MNHSGQSLISTGVVAAGNVCSLQSFVHRGSGVNHSGQSLISTGVVAAICHC